MRWHYLHFLWNCLNGSVSTVGDFHLRFRCVRCHPCGNRAAPRDGPQASSRRTISRGTLPLPLSSWWGTFIPLYTIWPKISGQLTITPSWTSFYRFIPPLRIQQSPLSCDGFLLDFKAWMWRFHRQERYLNKAHTVCLMRTKVFSEVEVRPDHLSLSGLGLLPSKNSKS